MAWGQLMRMMRRAIPIAVSIAVVCLVTAILWYLKLTEGVPRNPVFFYVLPIMVVAIVYGSGPALLGVVTAFACADYFLYDPLYSFEISSPVEFGDLTCFSLLAVIGVKCAVELFRPPAKLRARRISGRR
jgi:K+-sensing histidine kinase KdpD